MGKVALILRGGVSKINGKVEFSNERYGQSNYVNFKCVFNSIKKHIVDVNTDYQFDFFIHSWSHDLQKELDELYNPVISVYEDNLQYEDIIRKKLLECKVGLDLYNQASQALSITKSCEMFLNHSKDNNLEYDYIILYRPDVLIWGDIILSEYSKNIVYSNSYNNMEGDFHFVFAQDKIFGFISLFSNLSVINPPVPHYFIKHHLINKCNFSLSNDKIIAGEQQEVVRKLNLLPNKEFLIDYGISLDEIGGV